MSGENKNKNEPYRIIVFVIAVAFIIFMWVKKDIAKIYATMPSEQNAPLIVTTIVVSLLRVVEIAGAIFLIKWILGKIKRK